MTCHPLNICLYNLERQTSIPSERRSQGWNPAAERSSAHKDLSDSSVRMLFTLSTLNELEASNNNPVKVRIRGAFIWHDCTAAASRSHVWFALRAESTSVKKLPNIRLSKPRSWFSKHSSSLEDHLDHQLQPTLAQCSSEDLGISQQRGGGCRSARQAGH